MDKLSASEPNNRTIYWLWSLLLLAIIASALTIVRSEQKLSMGHLKINQLASEADTHLLQHAQLLAEKDALMNLDKLAMEAVEKFGMQAPSVNKIQILK